MSRQVEAHHFCSHINEDMRQCLIYDSTDPSAKLIGIEYIVSESLFETLPEEEKRYWHSHQFEVKGGVINMPGVLRKAETTALGSLVNTYGKAWHLWQVDRGDKLPLGEPKLMMALTEPKQIDQQALKARDQKYGITREELVEARKDLQDRPVAEGANHWLDSNGAWQTQMVKMDQRTLVGGEVATSKVRGF